VADENDNLKTHLTVVPDRSEEQSGTLFPPTPAESGTSEAQSKESMSMVPEVVVEKAATIASNPLLRLFDESRRGERTPHLLIDYLVGELTQRDRQVERFSEQLTHLNKFLSDERVKVARLEERLAASENKANSPNAFLLAIGSLVFASGIWTATSFSLLAGTTVIALGVVTTVFSVRPSWLRTT
jgi:hypothetical protein